MDQVSQANTDTQQSKSAEAKKIIDPAMTVHKAPAEPDQEKEKAPVPPVSITPKEVKLEAPRPAAPKKKESMGILVGTAMVMVILSGLAILVYIHS